MTRREAARVGAAIEWLRKADSDYSADARFDAVSLLHAIRGVVDMLNPIRERDAERRIARVASRVLPRRRGRSILPKSPSANIR